ncbi:MAG: T9SS type A sorting domain-containing protein [Bacteroidota bacterium]
MAKRITLTISILGILMLSTHLLNLPNPTPQKDGPGHPGWFEQYRLMKGDASMANMVRIQHQIDTRSQRSQGNLTNVLSLGPNNIGGRTRAINIDPQNSNTIIAGGISGGIWRSEDTGQTWTNVNDQAPNLAVTYITRDQFDDNIVYYSTGEPRGNSAGISGMGIFKSTDRGQTFTALPASQIPEMESIWTIKTSPLFPNYLYVGTHGDGAWISPNGGQNFFPLFNAGNGRVTDIEIMPDGSTFLTVTEDGVYFAPASNPQSFTKLGAAEGLPPGGFRRIELAYSRDVPTVIFAAYEEFSNDARLSGILGVWRSVDGGQNWTEMTNPSVVPNTRFWFPWYALLFEVSPTDPNFLMIGALDLVFSQNGGQSWQRAAASHPDHHIAVFDPSNPSMVWVGNDGGIYRFPVALMGSSRVDANIGYVTTQYYAGTFFPDGLEFLGGTQDNGTHRTLNDNPNVSIVWGGDGSYCQVSQSNPNVAYVSSQNGFMAKSVNARGGNPGFSLLVEFGEAPFDNPYFINPFELNPVDGDQLYVVTTNRIYRSTNGGQNFTPITLDPNGTVPPPFALGITADQNPTVYVGGQSAMLYRIDNAATSTAGQEVNIGNTAPPEVGNAFISCVTVHPQHDSVIFVSMSNFASGDRVWKVSAANTNTPVWTSLQGDLPDGLPVNWIEVSHQNPDYLVAATDFGLYTSTDGGQSWLRELNIPNVPVFQVRLRPADEKVFIFTHGRGVYAANLFDFATDLEEDLAENEWLIYPNPSTEIISVKGIEGKVSFRLMSMDGKLIQQGSYQNGEAIDVRFLPKGMYNLQIDQDGNREAKTFLKQ